VAEDTLVQIQDLSTHGTWVNGQKVPNAKEDPYTVFPGDEVSTYTYRIRIRLRLRPYTPPSFPVIMFLFIDIYLLEPQPDKPPNPPLALSPRGPLLSMAESCFLTTSSRTLA